MSLIVSIQQLTKRHSYWALAFGSTITFFFFNRYANQTEAWFSNPDQDIVLVMNTLLRNSGFPPEYRDHPSFGLFAIFGTLLKIFKVFSLTAVDQLADLRASKDPLIYFPDLIAIFRTMSFMAALGTATMVGLIARNFYRNAWIGLFAFMAALFSTGLFFQSLIIRSELVSYGLFVAAILVMQYAAAAKTNRGKLLIWFLSGGLFGWSAMTKIQAVYLYLPLWTFLIYFYDAGKTAKTAKHFFQDPFSWIRILCMASCVTHYIWLNYVILPEQYRGFTRCIPLESAAIIAIEILSYYQKFYRTQRVRSFLTAFCTAVAGFAIGVELMLAFNNAFNNGTGFSVLMSIFDPGHSSGFSLLDGQFVLSKFIANYVFGIKSFFSFYTTVTYSLPLAIAAYVFAHGWRKLWSPTFLGAMALFLWCGGISILRALNFHYAIYIDPPLYVLAISAFVELTSPKRKRRFTASGAVAWVCLLGLFYAGIATPLKGYVSYNWNNRDDIRANLKGGDVAEFIIERYGSIDAATTRVLNDPSLNGVKVGNDARHPKIRH